MAGIPSQRSITLEQVPGDFRQGLEPILRQLNPFMLAVTSGFNKALTLGANCQAQIQTVEVSMPTDDWTYVQPPQGTGTVFGANWSNQNGDASTDEQLRFRKTADGVVWLEGIIQTSAGSLPDSSSVTVLPAAYWPDTTLYWAGRCGSSSTPTVLVGKLLGSGLPASSGLPGTLVASGSVGNAYGIRLSYPAKDRTPIWPSPPFPLNYKSTLPSQARLLWLAKAVATDPNNHGIDNPTVNVGPVWVDWFESNANGSKIIKIRGVAGLAPGKTYRLTLVTMTG